MEYNHDQGVADGLNVDFDVYQICTKITASGSTSRPGYSWTSRVYSTTNSPFITSGWTSQWK